MGFQILGLVPNVRLTLHCSRPWSAGLEGKYLWLDRVLYVI